jgi:hypothetical protein
VVLEANERYTGLITSTKISQFLDVQILRYEIMIAAAPENSTA